MRRLAAAFAMLSAAALVGHAQSPGVVVRGRVLAADTGDPLPHARVVIYNDATPLAPLFTDGDGRFASSPLPTGRYRLSVAKAGYALTSVALESISVRAARATLAEGEKVSINPKLVTP